MGHLLTLVCNVLFSNKYTILVESILKSTKGGHLLTLVCNVLFSRKHTILVEAILKSTKGGSSAYFGLLCAV